MNLLQYILLRGKNCGWEPGPGALLLLAPVGSGPGLGKMTSKASPPPKPASEAMAAGGQRGAVRGIRLKTEIRSCASFAQNPFMGFISPG